jgi:DNA repair protein SbcD/Mre11
MKNPQALFLTDTHLKDGNDSLIESIFDQALEACLELDITNIVHGGDVFTNRKGQSLTNLLTFFRICYKFQKNGINFWVIPGNHDKTDQSLENSYLDIFNRHCRVISDENQTLDLGGVALHFLPYFTDEEYLSRLAKISQKTHLKSLKKNYLITHKDINGVVNNDGSVVEGVIKRELFKKFDKVIVGHYHNYQEFGNILYSGSTHQTNYGETWEDKGFLIIGENGELARLPTVFPKYLKITCSVTDDKKEIFQSALKAKEENNFVRFIFKGKRSDLDKLNFSDLETLGVEVRYESEEFNESIQSVENDEFVEFDKKTILKEFNKYCSENSISKDLKNFGLKILLKNV